MSRECRICGRMIEVEGIDPDELIGSQEAVEITGMKRTTFNMARVRGQAPEPIAELACGPIWTKTQIEEWAAARYAKRPS